MEKENERKASTDLDQHYSTLFFFFSYLYNPINIDDVCRMFKDFSSYRYVLVLMTVIVSETNLKSSELSCFCYSNTQ